MTPTPRFETMMAQLKRDAKTADELRLLAIFEEHSEVIGRHYESCVPALNGSDYWKYKPSNDFPLNEFHGPLFHKGFRQFDVVVGDRGETDVTIWKLLNSGNVAAFWNAHTASMQT